MNQIDYEPAGARGALEPWHIVIVASRFNQRVVDQLLEGAIETLGKQGIEESRTSVIRVPGAFELPQAVQMVLTGQGVPIPAPMHARVDKVFRPADAVIALGAVIRGETPHFDYVCSAAVQGLNRVALDTRVPVAMGVLTADTSMQALERAGGKAGNKGSEAALAVLEMLGLANALKPGAS